VLAQLGHRVQHALRAFTEDDDKALRAAARTFPKTPFYDIDETLTTLGIGEAFVTVLTQRGVPTPPFSTRLIPPASKMAPLPELAERVRTSPQVHKYANPVDRESARERLAARIAPETGPAYQPMPGVAVPQAPAARAAPVPKRSAGQERSTFEQIIKAPVTRTVAGVITRGLMGALLGSPRRRRRY
jgi:hypothetical protein